ncbi:unnamed protein product, partial [Rotaria socialis]
GSSVTLKPQPPTTDVVSTVTQNIQQLDISDDCSMLDDVRICPISQQNDPAWLIDLDQQHQGALATMKIELDSLSNGMENLKTGIKESDDKMKLAEHEKKHG